MIILVGVSLVWQLFLMFKSPITTNTSSWVVFLNENTESSFLFNIENTGVFFKRFNASWERMCFLCFLCEKWENVFFVFFVWKMRECVFCVFCVKNDYKNQVFLSLIYEKRNNSFPEGFIIRNFFVLSFSKFQRFFGFPH